MKLRKRSINRNIVECKVSQATCFINNPVRINRNIVECKVCMSAQLEVVDAVLIETLWNVKTEDDAKAVEAASVLIETLWNVKRSFEDSVSPVNSINRNIVECKVDRLKLASDISLSINRNIVECKDAIINRYDTKIAVLIETLWNVKIEHYPVVRGQMQY